MTTEEIEDKILKELSEMHNTCTPEKQIIKKIFSYNERRDYENLINRTIGEMEFRRFIEVSTVTSFRFECWEIQLTQTGLNYCLKRKKYEIFMTEEEKLKIIINDLYEKRHSSNALSLKKIITERGIYTSEEENWRLAEILFEEGFAEVIRMKGDISVKIKNKGIKYCENNYQIKPNAGSTTNNFNFSGPYANFIQNSHRVSINQTFGDSAKALELIKDLKIKIEEEQILDDLKQDMKDCVDLIADKITANQKVPNVLMNNLLNLGNAANISSVGSFVTQLMQILGILPKE